MFHRNIRGRYRPITQRLLSCSPSDSKRYIAELKGNGLRRFLQKELKLPGVIPVPLQLRGIYFFFT